MEIRLDLAEQPLPENVDVAQLEVALLNLVVNARDATNGRGAITIHSRAYCTSKQEHGSLVPGKYVAIAISDTGIGMSADVLSKVFEPFFTTKPPTKGTGLGLSQVYGLVRQSGGDVKIESTPAMGTTVTMYFPMKRAFGKINSTSGSQKTSTVVSRSVLLVEQDEGVRTVAMEMLHEVGHSVSAVRNDKEALAILRGEARVDLLIADATLGIDCGGPNLLQQALEIRPGIHILACTASFDSQSASRNVLKKPFDSGRLAEAIEFVFSKEFPSISS